MIPLANGDVAELTLDREVAVITKTPFSPEDNDLMATESSTLRVLNSQLPANTWRQCVPKIVSSGMVDGKRANHLQLFPGFVDLETIKLLRPNGVDGRTIVWMWKRLVNLLEYVHGLGFVHGAVLPPHIMFYPDDHSAPGRDLSVHAVRLVDWCYSQLVHWHGSRMIKLKAWCPRYENFYPSEVPARRSVYFLMDYWMAARSIETIMADDVPETLRQCILSWTLMRMDRPDMQIKMVRDHFETFVNRAAKIYGPPKFQPFNLPGLD